jgi:hypothetical protein
MKIQVFRYNSDKDHSNGVMLIDYKFFNYTLEDEYRTKKVWGKTRIPAGIYDVELRTEGMFHDRYFHKFGSKFHKGMLHIKDVPNFKYVLIHIGNTDDDTAGCILVGQDPKGSENFISSSTLAYKKMYPVVRDALLSGEKVQIEIIDLDKPE